MFAELASNRSLDLFGGKIQVKRNIQLCPVDAYARAHVCADSQDTLVIVLGSIS